MSIGYLQRMTSTNLTDETAQRLRDELDVLRARREELTELPDGQDGVGDRADDAQNLQRLDDAALLDDRIAELTRLLAGGHPGAEHSDDRLPVGTVVTLRHPDGSTETLRVVAITEQAAPGEQDDVFTLDSPLGRALADGSGGATVRYHAPDGERELEIVELRRPG